jgi:HK97 family phage major capsid protein
MNLEELRLKAQEVQTDIARLADLTEPTADDTTALEARMGEWDTIKPELDAEELRAAKIEEIRAAAVAGNIDTPSRRAVPVPGARDRNPFDMSDVRAEFSAQQTFVAQSDAEELRGRAREAIDTAAWYVTDEARQAATELVDRDRGGWKSAHILRYGSPEYTEQFIDYMRTGQQGAEVRAAMSTTAANGGAMIPSLLDPTVILTNASVANPFRAISRQVTINRTTWNGVSSAGVTAEWTSQAAEVTDASPTFSSPSITPIRADAHVTASLELLEDSDNLVAEVTRMFADARDRLEGAAFATGTGSTQPLGIVTALGLTTASRVSAQTNGSFGIIDVFALVNALPARYEGSANWVAHKGIFSLVRQMQGTNNALYWQDSLQPGVVNPAALLGYGAYSASAMQSSLSTATASSDDILILGDFSNYVIVDRMGLEVVYNPLVLGSSALRPTGQVSWTAFWRVGAKSVNDDAFRMLRV